MKVKLIVGMSRLIDKVTTLGVSWKSGIKDHRIKD